jgi:hypothetical protein
MRKRDSLKSDSFQRPGFLPTSWSAGGRCANRRSPHLEVTRHSECMTGVVASYTYGTRNTLNTMCGESRGTNAHSCANGKTCNVLRTSIDESDDDLQPLGLLCNYCSRELWTPRCPVSSEKVVSVDPLPVIAASIATVNFKLEQGEEKCRSFA